MSPNCRDCSERVRERCIRECTASPSVKMMIRRAFVSGSDTQQLWELLQMNCPLEPTKGRAAEATPPPPPATSEPETARAGEGVRKPVSPYFPSAPVTRPQVERPIPTKPAESVSREVSTSRYCLALEGSRHRIALPTEGQIVLGRFDPATTINPDVDLSYDDRANHIISRRHARIIAHEGQHLIEDMGSTNGTMVNMQRLKIGQKVLLRSGDRVILGDHRLFYRAMPKVQTSPHTPIAACLWATFSGRRFSLPTWGEVIVGRSDPVVGFVPDIDLKDEGDSALVVARRHVKISARSGRHYVEDMGSANGTKLNGVRLGVGERGLLEPGDHLWLGGCVLAYDIEP